jgi:hypothetical protein
MLLILLFNADGTSVMNDFQTVYIILALHKLDCRLDKSLNTGTRKNKPERDKLNEAFTG